RAPSTRRAARGRRRTPRRGSRGQRTSFAPQITMLGRDTNPQFAQPARELLGDRNAPMLATGAADRDGQVPLAFALESRRGRVDESRVCLDERRRTTLVQHVPAHRLVLAGQVAKLRLPEWVRQEPGVEYEVRVGRQAVLEAERQHRDSQPPRVLAAEQLLDA